MKKILALFLSVTIAFSAFMCYGLNAAAAGTTKKAVLQVKDIASRDIVDFDIKTTKDSGSNPKCGVVTIKTKALKDDNTQLLQWAFNSDDIRDVEIVVSEPALGFEVKKIVLKGSECIHYEETYETAANGSVVNYESISIVCNEIINSNVSLKTK